VPKLVGNVWRMTYPAPDWIDLFEDSDGRGVVFCDELTTAEPSIQAAELGLINNRRIGGAQLPRGVRVIGAANDPNVAANGWALSAPLANRLGHKQYQNPTEDDWGAHMLASTGVDEKPTETFDAAQEEARVERRWPSAWAAAVGLVTTFHSRNRGNLHKMPEHGRPEAGRAWPSHRSWSRATAAIATGPIHNLSEAETLELVAAFIGDGATRALIEFKLKMNLPDPVDLLNGKATWEHDIDRVDRSMAVINTIAAYALSLKLDASSIATDKRIERMWKIIEACPVDDVIAMSLPPLSRARYTSNGHALNVLARLRPMMKAAGLVT
jgi:hypothetical protein